MTARERSSAGPDEERQQVRHRTDEQHLSQRFTRTSLYSRGRKEDRNDKRGNYGDIQPETAPPTHERDGRREQGCPSNHTTMAFDVTNQGVAISRRNITRSVG